MTLLMRVAGHSYYFTNFCSNIREKIIKRTENGEYKHQL